MNEEQLAIMEVQQYLRNISKVNSDINSVVPDGIFGPETKSAVSALQAKNGMEQTGSVDFETWKMLLEENKNALFILSEPIQVAPISNSDLPLKRGDRNQFVHTLKLMLNDVASNYPNFNIVEIDDYFDEPTENEVKRWQRIIVVPETGIVDKLTWNLLAEHYRIKE